MLAGRVGTQAGRPPGDWLETAVPCHGGPATGELRLRPGPVSRHGSSRGRTALPDPVGGPRSGRSRPIRRSPPTGRSYGGERPPSSGRVRAGLPPTPDRTVSAPTRETPGPCPHPGRGALALVGSAQHQL